MTSFWQRNWTAMGGIALLLLAGGISLCMAHSNSFATTETKKTPLSPPLSAKRVMQNYWNGPYMDARLLPQRRPKTTTHPDKTTSWRTNHATRRNWHSNTAWTPFRG